MQMARQNAETSSARDTLREVQNNLVKSLKSTIIGSQADTVEENKQIISSQLCLKESRCRSIDDHEESQWLKALEARKNKELKMRRKGSSSKSSQKVAFYGKMYESMTGLYPGEPSPQKQMRYIAPFALAELELEPGTRSASPTVKNTTVFSTPINTKMK